MAALFASGRVVDAILVLTVLEAAALTLYLWRARRMRALGDLAANLAAGMALMLALRLALGGAWWGWLALCLSVAGLGHLVYLARIRRE